MIAEQFQGAFHKWWEDICVKVNKALVFLDSPAAESLHWNGGLYKVLNAGANNVKAFSPFERGEKTEQKALFVITSPLLEEELHILQAILQISSFVYCIVITTIPEYAYSQYLHTDVEKEHFFQSVEMKLLNWMGNQNYMAEVSCIPVAGMSIGHKFFLMPSFHAVFPQLLPDSTSENMNVSEWKSRGTPEKTLPFHKDIEIKALAYTLNALFEYMHVKEDVFSIGHLSSMLGSELESLSAARNRRKTASKKVSLVLVDRTLDIAGALSQNCYSMLDRVVRVLPHLPGHTCDVAIDMSPLCASNGGKVFGISLLAPGCLADDNDPKRTLLNTFISKRQKDCMMTINRHLVEKANVGSSLETGCHVRRITPEQLQKQVLKFRDLPDWWKDNIGVLQYALAIVQTLQHPDSNILDEIQSTEQLLIQNLAASDENAFQNLICLLSNRKQRSLSLVTILTLIAYLYALEYGRNFISILDEQKLQAALVGAIFQDSDDLPPFLLDLIGDSVEENNVISTVNMIFRQLKSLNMPRKSMKRYKSVFQHGDIVHPASYVPLLKQLLEDIFNTSLTDLPDLEYHSAGFKDYLKSSFSLFMNITKPQPRDSPTVIVLVLGGITATEVNQIREIGEKSSNEVIIGSTMLVTPHDIMKKIFNMEGK